MGWAMIAGMGAFDLDGRVRSTGYWLSVSVLTLANTCVLGITSAAAGLSIDAFIDGSREVVFLNMIALILLIWPAIAIAMRRFHQCRNGAFLGLGLYALAIFTFMFAYFGKPFDVPALTGSLKLLPTVLFLVVAAWLTVEIFLVRDHDRVAAA